MAAAMMAMAAEAAVAAPPFLHKYKPHIHSVYIYRQQQQQKYEYSIRASHANLTGAAPLRARPI